MKTIKININILKHGPKESPKYATRGSSGMDIKAAIEKPYLLKINERKIIPSGIKVEIPKGYEIQIRPRSGLALKNGITILNSPGTIDSDYRGEIGVILVNLSNHNFIVKPGERIAQLVIAKYEQIKWKITQELPNTIRGDGGFGSTGKK